MNQINSTIIDGTNCTILGWGKTGPSNPNDSANLMILNILANSSASCMKANETLTKNMLCSQMTEENKRAAGGDSGGPMLCNEKLAGLISGFDRVTNITAYTKVDNYDVGNSSQWKELNFKHEKNEQDADAECKKGVDSDGSVDDNSSFRNKANIFWGIIILLLVI